MGKSIFFVLLMCCLLAGCAAMGPRIIIEVPSQPQTAVQTTPSDIVELWYFDPTFGAVKNDSGGWWGPGVYMAVWIDSQFKGPPMFRLDPGMESWPKNIPLARHNLCVEGEIKTATGPQSLGRFCRQFEVTVNSRYGNYGWYERISAWDFPRK